jgi:hypothetical protein
LIEKPTLVVHTTFIGPHGDPTSDEHAAASRLGDELYDLLTRPKGDPLAWGAGIPVRVATASDQIDRGEAETIIVIPVLGAGTFQDEDSRCRALQTIEAWEKTDGLRVAPVPLGGVWLRSKNDGNLRRLFSPLHETGAACRPVVDEIFHEIACALSDTDAFATRLYISIARDDLSTSDEAADKIRAYISGTAKVAAFFPQPSLLVGEDLDSLVEGESEGVFLAIRGDRYSSRAWCRRELLRAKQRRLSTLVVEVLSSGESRSAAYGGNGPTVVWNRGDAAGSAARVMTFAMVEAVRHLHFQAEGQRVIAAAALPVSTVCLSRPPELLDIPTLRGRTDAAVVVLHPDPPLPAFERALLQEADKRMRTVTPTSIFSGASETSIRAPLEGWQIALGLSQSPDAPAGGGPAGLTSEHLRDATTFLVRALIGVGAAIAYGGDLREHGFTPFLSQLIVAHNETAQRNADLLHCYFAASRSKSAARDLQMTVHEMRTYARAVLPAPMSGEFVPAWRETLYVSDMRARMAESTRARVIIGGAARPASRFAPGYGGRLPGVAEEALWTLRREKPLYVAGGFGGGSGLVARALQCDQAPEELDDARWAGDPLRDALVARLGGDPEYAKLGLPKDLVGLASELRSFGRRHLASDDASLAWNGLTIAENHALFRTRDPLSVAALALKGLLAVSTRDARGKVRIELVEGDVSEASGLNVFVFPTFSDVPISGAGAALDRVSGNAATLAHRTGVIAPSASAALGADFLHAAKLGPLSEVLEAPTKHIADAAAATAQVLRRHGFRRAGIVTFLGNVAQSLGEVVNAMIDGLYLAGDMSELVWFERDPVRMAIIASVLGADDRVVLSRRAAPGPTLVPAPTGKRRTVIAVRHAGSELEVDLLLHQANGLAPMLRSELTVPQRLALAGKTTDGAPQAEMLEALGDRIVQLVFGGNDSRVLGPVGNSELVIMHDEFAAGIPYEAMSWKSERGRVTPAAERGLVRHILTRGVRADEALTRPPRIGNLGVLVVIDPRDDLRGAREEGELLIKHLYGGPYDVTPLRSQEATVKRVAQAIADPAIDVFHYCGHAFFKDTGLAGSGLRCADGDLTLGTIRDIKSVPRLAFVNACQAGRMRDAPPDMREPQAFAELFLRAGVDAYLGAFWLVSDAGAATFAAVVYEALARGLELGDAVVEGRKKLQSDKNSDWANYVLYGHVGFRLVQSSEPSLGAEGGALPAPSARVDSATVVASWFFFAKDAPSTFAVAAVATDSTPFELKRPIHVERREGWSDSKRIVTWMATVSLGSPLARALELRPSAGGRIAVPAPAGAANNTRGVGEEVLSELAALRRLLAQQPDGGIAFLSALHSSADPHELRARIEGDGTTRGIWPFDDLGRPKVDESLLDEFCEAYKVNPISVADAESQKFQTKEDWKNYVFAPGAVAFTAGADVLPPVWPLLPNPAAAMTHDLLDGEFTDEIEMALFSDNGNGLHASRAIAKQVVDSKLPYAFHLGDVYYGGDEREFRDYFEVPLAGMFDRTELFMITGNHEMYAKGRFFQDLIARKAGRFPLRQRQRGEMFRLRGPGFSILGVDTMFVGWNAGCIRRHDRADRSVLDVVETWLAERPQDLTILMTTNEPWSLGRNELTPLYDSLRETIAGRLDLWFWGNVHYAALYEPWEFPDANSPTRRVVGSCIGHGGYPFYSQEAIGPLPAPVRCRWLEQKSRFWPYERLRPDVGANGWCRLKLARKDQRWDVGLTFVDWVGRPRLRVSLARKDGETISLAKVEESSAAGVGAPLTWCDVPERKA